MSDVASLKLCVLWEHELKLAAAAVKEAGEKLHEGPKSKLTQEQRDACLDALQVCEAALFHVEEDSALVLSSAAKIRGERRPRSKP